ncbi:unnamed protein product [Prunus armeniaca]|uniref:Uncharacterized protein n=1 Tax=Prunus armeniaca TaxID=36596 RepID=A0A6J5Y4Z9_PRUAR|nr:unnamed protein product [Prunus armeniaca]
MDRILSCKIFFPVYYQPLGAVPEASAWGWRCWWNHSTRGDDDEVPELVAGENFEAAAEEKQAS